MPTVTFIPIEGAPIVADLIPEMTLMELALMNDVPGILGMCGGICSCATCHIHIDPAWVDRLLPPSAEERDMVEALSHATPASRLGCQIRLNENFDGLTASVAQPE